MTENNIEIPSFYNKKWFWAILSILLIELFAIYQGIDGVALSATIGGLAGLGGYALGQTKSEG